MNQTSRSKPASHRDDGQHEVAGIVGLVVVTSLLTVAFLAVCFAGGYSASLKAPGLLAKSPAIEAPPAKQRANQTASVR